MLTTYYASPAVTSVTTYARYCRDLLQGKLSQDQALLQDPEIKGLVEMYAADQVRPGFEKHSL